MKPKTHKKNKYKPSEHEWGTDASVRHAKKVTPRSATKMIDFKEFAEAFDLEEEAII